MKKKFQVPYIVDLRKGLSPEQLEKVSLPPDPSIDYGPY
jgi:hypothetical protein